MNNFLKKVCNSARRDHINKTSEDLKSKTVLEFCLINAQGIKRTYVRN